MGLYLDSKKVGDYIDIMGPLGVNEYLGAGVFKLPGRTITVKHVGMMAGGTGLTPMLQARGRLGGPISEMGSWYTSSRVHLQCAEEGSTLITLWSWAFGVPGCLGGICMACSHGS